MRYPIPTHLRVEPPFLHLPLGLISIPLTFSQLGWFAIAGLAVLCALPWRLPPAVTLAWAFLALLVGLAGAFVTINGLPLDLWLLVWLLYRRRPRRAVWQPTPYARPTAARAGAYTRYTPRLAWTATPPASGPAEPRPRAGPAGPPRPAPRAMPTAPLAAPPLLVAGSPSPVPSPRAEAGDG